MQNNSKINDGRPPQMPPPKPQRSPSLNSTYPTNPLSGTSSSQIRPGQQRFSLTPHTMGMDDRNIAAQNQNTSTSHQQNKLQHSASETYAKPEFRQCASYEYQPSSSAAATTTANVKAESTNLSFTEHDSGYSPNISECQSVAPPSPTPGYPPTYVLRSRNSAPSTSTNVQCLHPFQARSSLPDSTAAYYEHQVQKFSPTLIGDSARVNGVLNDVYRNRLRDIEQNAEGDVHLQLATYKEWVDMLLKVNESTISNMEELEAEVAERLEFLQRKVSSNCRHSQGNELLKCRKDINTLIKFIRESCQYDVMNVSGITFETISPAMVFGNVEGAVAATQMGNSTDPETMQRNMLYANLKALALEVAEKHDEVRDLKRQVVCLEDEIQKATKKIQFKDNVIQKLRDDLKCYTKSPVETCSSMPQLNSDTPRSDASTLVSEDNPSRYLDDVSSQFECLSQTEHMVEEKVKTLHEELDEYYDLQHKDEMQRKEMEKRIKEIVRKSECEKVTAYRKLDFMRRQLIDLESSALSETTTTSNEADNDSGIGSKNEFDKDAKILETIRKRLRSLNDSNFELNRQVQTLKMENNKLSTNLESTKHISERNSETLRSVAALLNSLTGNFSYAEMYNHDKNQCETNPFCKAIMDIKGSYQDRENKLLHTITVQNKKIEELSKALHENEKLFGHQQRQRMNNALKCQIQHLKKAIMDREQHILHLTAVLNHHNSQNPTAYESCRANPLPHATAKQTPPTGPCCSNQQRVTDLEKRLDTMSKELDKSQRQEYFLHSETRKLNEQLNESKRKNADLASQAQRLAGLLKSQEVHRSDLAKKYDSLEESFEDQAKKLRTANAQLTVLNERFQLMERQQHEHNLERKLLHDEVLALKEKEAIVMGRQKSLQEQLAKTEKELYTAHNVMRDQTNIMKTNDLKHAEELQRLKEEHYDTKRKLKNLTEDYKRLQEAYENEQEICKQSEKLLNSFRKWKEQQLKADAENREKFQKMEAHIQLLYQDKLEMLNAQRSMWLDYKTLEAELERLSQASFNVSNPRLGVTVTNEMLAERLSAIKKARSRIIEQTLLMEEALREEDKLEVAEDEPGPSKTTTATGTDDRPRQESSNPG